MSAPMLSCPAWCTAHSDKHNVHSSGRRWPRDGAGPSVVILQAVSAAEPSLNFDGVRVEIGDAGLLAGAMERLGHTDVAAAITEAAALVTEAADGAS